MDEAAPRDHLSGMRPLSSSEAALLLVSTKNRDLWPGSPRFTDFPSLCACSESSLTNLIGSGLNLLCLQIHSKPECRWIWPEVAILGADQQECGLWGREWNVTGYVSAHAEHKFGAFGAVGSAVGSSKGRFTRYDFVAYNKLSTGLRHDLRIFARISKFRILED